MNTSAKNANPLDRYDALLALFAFAGAFAMYARTLVPGLLPGDGGEFQTLAYLLGHTHPTGYPVYLSLARLWVILPTGEIAYRVNLFSALMGALAVALVYLAGRVLVKRRILALLGAAILAVSPTLWSQAVIAEIYTSGACILAAIILALLIWDRESGFWSLFLAGLAGGLCLGIHMSVAILAPAVLVFLLTHWKRGWKIWIQALCGALVGVVLTVLLFWLTGMANPTGDYFASVVTPSHSSWELEADQIDGPLEKLLFGWSAKQFRSFLFSDIKSVMPRQAGEYFAALPGELSWVGILFAVLGTVALFTRCWRVGVLLLGGLLVQWLYFFNYQIWDLYVFYISSYILLALLTITGMEALAGLLESELKRLGQLKDALWPGLVASGAVALLVLVLACRPLLAPRTDALLAGKLAFKGEPYPSYNPNLEATAFATVVQLPPDAVVFTNWGMMWPYYYTAHIQADRRDLIFIETMPADDQPDMAASLVAFARAQAAERPVFFSERHLGLGKAGFKINPKRFGPTRLYQIK